MIEVELRFYEELNDHLPPSRRKRSFSHRCGDPMPVGELIRSFGVPLAEVELTLVNGESVGGNYLVSNGDRISVFPVFEAFDITPLVRLRSGPLRRIRFAVDADLSELGRLLHRRGFDAVPLDDSGAFGAHNPNHGSRIVLTRNVSRLEGLEVTHGLLVRSTDPHEQLEEVVQRLHLTGGRL